MNCFSASFFMGAALVLASFTAISCNGNGGSSNSEGEIYTGGGTSIGSTSSGGSSTGTGGSGSGGNISAIDILKLSNAGDTDGIVAVFQPATSTGDDTAGTRTVVLNAAAIGMPSDGTATLSITGRGINYEVTATVDADGNVTFEVPAIATGTEVTVALVIKTSGGAVLYAGSKTQVLTGDVSSLNISLARQYWAMPASIGATASPDTLEYDPATLDSESTTFSIIGLSDAPAGVSYSWTDESGTVVGTGATLTRTVNEMLGAGFTPSAASEERTYTVTVSYTDATGTAATLTASATATIVTTATIRLTASGIQSEGGRQILVLKKAAAGTAATSSLSADVLCYGGTASYSWTPSNPALGSVSASGAHNENASISPAAGGISTLTVTATLDDGRILTRELDVYVLDVQIAGATLSTSSTSPTLMAEGGSAVNLTASLAGIADLEGAEFTWEVSPAPSDPSKPFLKLTPGGAGNASCSLEPKQAAVETHILTAKTTYRGVEVQAERYIKVVGLRLTGGADVLFLNHSETATNTLSLTLTPVGVTLADLGSTVLFSSDDSSIATASPASTGAGCTVKAAQAGSPAAFTYATGVVTVTVTATAGPDAIPLSYEKEIPVLDLVVKQGTTVLPASGNRLPPSGTKALTAELKGPPAGSTVTYEWTTVDGTKISVSPTDSASTTLTGVAAGDSDITVTATYKDNDYPRAMAFRCAHVTMKTGLQINSILTNLGAGSSGAARSFAASNVPPAVGTTTYELSAAGSAGTCIAWLDGGTTIKYYAEGYTDASPAVKIPLDADCEKMFYCCAALTDIDLSGFDARNVTTMASMFDSCENLVNLNLSGFDTSNVTTMYKMFNACDRISSLDLSSFDTSNVTNMSGMFMYCGFSGSLTSLDLSSFDTSNVTTMASMFYECRELTSLNVSSFDTSNVTSMAGMFEDCRALPSLDLSSFDTSNVTGMHGMFNDCYVITTITVSPSFVTTAITSTFNSDMMFNACSQLQGGNGTTYDSSKTNKEYARIDAPGTPGYFTAAP